MTSVTTDFLVIGAGIVGLTIARELKHRYPSHTVTVLEKELAPGRHSSGRNSGVLHSGIYYPPESLKAQVCTQGAREMAQYCESRHLPLQRLGKILVPTHMGDPTQIDLLIKRGRANGVVVERLDAQQLEDLEREAHSATGEALFVPQTSVVSSSAVIKAIVSEVEGLGISIRCGGKLTEIGPDRKQIRWNDELISYGHVINAAGLHADNVAHQFGVGERYTLLPFKGLYWKLDPASGINVTHLIYPFPDLRVPFLGVHTTTSTDGTVYLGPTAVPAFGRENYRNLQGVSFAELMRIGSLLTRQFAGDRDGFRRMAWQEGRRYFKPWFVDAAQALLPRLRPEHLLTTDKVGIRAQMLDTQTGHLVNDFLVERGHHSTHVLNAISPAFTSAFPFARHICDNYIEKR